MSPHLPLLKDADVRGKRVLLRLNLDLPVENDILVDTYRIDSAGKTLAFLRDHKARTLIIGHVGRDPQESLRPIFEYLKKNFPVSFVSTLEEAKEAMASLQEGSFLLLENLRSFSGETKNAPVFTRELAALADVYVNEAFAVSHREHTSIVGIPTLLPCYAGFVFADEVEH